jgi:hypothetical protein
MAPDANQSKKLAFPHQPAVQAFFFDKISELIPPGDPGLDVIKRFSSGVTGVAFSQKIDSYLATKIGAGRALELRKRPECRQRGKRRRRILSRAAVYLSIKNGPIAAPQVPVCFLGNAQNHFEVLKPPGD